MESKNRRYAIIGISSVLLVAMVLVVTLGFIGNNQKKFDKHITLSRKTLLDICHAVDFRDACISNLPFKILRNNHDPKELLHKGFEVAMTHLRTASQRTLSLGLIHREPRTQGALTSCRELTEMAISDLQRSVDKFINHEIGSLARILNDLLIWVSGAMTYQETCLDGFVNTNTLVGQHMRLALRTGMELTTNVLGMMTQVATKFEASIQVTTTLHNRRLKSTARFPEWVESDKRRLLEDNQGNVKADLVVAQDGSGKYRTINDALWDIPKHSDNTFVLYVKEGVYKEKVQFNSSMRHVMLIGDGPRKTRITGSLNFVDGTPTYQSATVAIAGDYFIAKDIGFENTAGPEKHQAVALRVAADKSVFYNCQMDGYQDTLYTHTYRQFYRDCVVSGTVDFVFGDAAAIFQNCTFLVRKPMDNQQCIVTAQGRKNERQPTGIVFQNCTITDEASLHPVKNNFAVYLGRPWKEYSRTVIMESYLDDLIRPEGFLPWMGTIGLNTLFYTEFNNRGPGSSKDKRVNWPGIKELSPDRIQYFTANKFIQADGWVPSSKVPYSSGLMFQSPQQGALGPVPDQDFADSAYKNIRDSYSSHANFTPTPSPTPSANTSPPAPVSDNQGSSTSPADNSASRTTQTAPSNEIGQNSASPASTTVPSAETGSNPASPDAPTVPSTQTGSNFGSRDAPPDSSSTVTGSNFASRDAPRDSSSEVGSNFASRDAPRDSSSEVGSNFASHDAPRDSSSEVGSNFASRDAPRDSSSGVGSNFASRDPPSNPSPKLNPDFPFSTIIKFP
ncbi:hypothetical protein DCAR_0933852 [Daucus carota subsp. sativus]|uniref:pectinesterase n=1 Tax=Daucus carota subsp. sativus TaxID=79200 RepID=A0AAF1BDU3_DAUCS|nr:hypothetical protein DCAR_0933852 [Daucus carota subsp. sativus]